MRPKFRTPLPSLGERAIASRGAISIEITVGHKRYWGFMEQSTEQFKPGFPTSFEVQFWGDYFGKVFYTDHWACSLSRDQLIIDRIGEYIMAWFR